MADANIQKVHQDSAPGLMSALDLFSVPMSNTNIDSTIQIQYSPIAPLTDSQIIEFIVPSSDMYIDLGATLLEIHAKITHGDGTKLRPAAVAATANVAALPADKVFLYFNIIIINLKLILLLNRLHLLQIHCIPYSNNLMFLSTTLRLQVLQIIMD